MLKTGAMIGERYEIVGKIGSGGMADVYKAKDHKLNRFVAVKVMKVEFNNDDSFIRKFRREAQAAAGLANPNIVNVFDVGEDGGLYYIVMELVEGITLKEYVEKKHKLSVREATSIAIQVCMGLSAAHAQGIVHRDIKPQNIIISTDGKVKVTDFGIARAASSNTISANAMGSVHYSSPEQVRGGYSDAKSDIYSLGITLYEMVTGKVPFDGETTVAIAIKHLQEEMDPPSKYTPDLPYSLEQIIYKCTQKSPDRRYNSVNEVIADLKRSLTDPDGHFVSLTPLSDHAQTVSITPAEMQAIKAGASGRTGKGEGRTGGRAPYDEYDYEQEDGDDEGGLSGKLEKAMTIGGFIVGAIIICVLVYFIGRAAGLFRSSGAESSSAGTSIPESFSEEPDAEDLIEVPNLIGLTREQAQTTVTGLSIGIKYAGEEPSEEYAQGEICRQDPEPYAQVARQSTILFYVSSGRAQIAVPGVTGRSLSDAQKVLRDAGFTDFTDTTAPSDSVPVGNVISVSPQEGASVDPDTQIVLTVSSGPAAAAEMVNIPSLRGLAQEDAVSALQRMGLRASFQYGYDSSLSIGDVMGQSVPGGTDVAVGSEIILTINSEDYMNVESSESQNPEGAQNESSAQSQAEVVSNWYTDVRLDTTSEYQGGAYRLTLVQNVNGENLEYVIEEGQELIFPYEFQYEAGAAGVETGDVYLYEEVGGSYVRKAKWTVPFFAP